MLRLAQLRQPSHDAHRLDDDRHDAFHEVDDKAGLPVLFRPKIHVVDDARGFVGRDVVTVAQLVAG